MEEYNIKVYDNGNIEVEDSSELYPTIIASCDLEEALEVLKKIIIRKHEVENEHYE